MDGQINGKMLFLRLPEGTFISSISMLCVVTSLLGHSRRRAEGGFPGWC